MTMTNTLKWAFKARFRRGAFGWKSAPAIQRVKEAVAEIKKVAKADKVLAAEGAVQFLERISPALQQVDSSSGAIGSAVNRAIEDLVAIIAKAPVDSGTRAAWLDRLWEALQDDAIPYIETLGEYWGELCSTPTLASAWADEWCPTLRSAWGHDRAGHAYFKGTIPCLSALVAAERYDEVLELLKLAPYDSWHYCQYGVKALIAQGKKAEAIQYAEQGRGLNDSPIAIARCCETILLSLGLVDESYKRYGLMANESSTYLATFRSVAKKYPHKSAAEILADLVKTTPGAEGKWFAAAKDAGLYDEALVLARTTPCDPKTLTRAARDYAESEPSFAVDSGLLALYWLVQGYGYEISSADVWAAYDATMKAAKTKGTAAEVADKIRRTVMTENTGDRFLTKILARELGL
jgi:tetratricopeptide (TPR) repeat protein